MWFAFVWLKDWPNELPEVFFVPLATVAACMKGEKDASWPFFWIRVKDADEYRGETGFQKLKAALIGHSPAIRRAPDGTVSGA